MEFVNKVVSTRNLKLNLLRISVFASFMLSIEAKGNDPRNKIMLFGFFLSILNNVKPQYFKPLIDGNMIGDIRNTEEVKEDDRKAIILKEEKRKEELKTWSYRKTMGKLYAESDSWWCRNAGWRCDFVISLVDLIKQLSEVFYGNLRLREVMV